MKVNQNSFTGGEQSPSMFGRIDDAKYQTGLAICRNFVCLPQGPVQNRSGFEFVRAAKYADRPCRLIPFVFSSAQTMVLELGDRYIRFHTQGQTLLASNGEPYEVSTPYDAADLDEINFAQSGDVVTLVHVKYAPRELRRYGATDWRLEEIKFGAPLSAPTNLQGAYLCNAKAETVTDAMKTMYNIRYCVTAIRDTDTGFEESAMSATCSVDGNLFLDASKVTLTWAAVSGAQRYRIYKTYSGVYGYIGETESTTFQDTNIEADEGVTPPRYDDPFYQNKGISSVSVTNPGAGYGSRHRIVGAKSSGVDVTVWMYSAGKPVQFNYPNSTLPSEFYMPWDARAEGVPATGGGTGATARFVTTREGSGAYRLAGVELVTTGEGYTADARFIKELKNSNGTGWRISAPAITEPKKPTAWIEDPTGYGAELEVQVSGGQVTAIRVVNPGANYSNPRVVIDSTNTGGAGATATASVGKAGDYPGAVSYYEQRRIFAGTTSRPQFVWMTRPGTESDMSYTLPSKDDNRIKFRIASVDASRIRHVVPINGLLFLTASAELRATTANDDALTPSSVGVRTQSYIGSSAVPPLLVNSNAIFAAERGGHIRELGYSQSSGGFVTGDISLRAVHLFQNKRIKSMALMKAPEQIIWAVSSDGTLLGCTYVPEQAVCAWHRHDTLRGKFESIACVSEGDEDIVYAVVERVINGATVRYVERMRARLFGHYSDGFFVDSGLTYKGEAVTKLTGLNHLEGETVSILADGVVVPPQKVVNGGITLEQPAAVVHVGLPITADLKTLPAIINARDGGAGRGTMKNARAAYIRVYESSGLSAGPDQNNLTVFPPRTFEGYGQPPVLRSDEIEVSLAPTWSDGGQVYVRQQFPLPMMICSITTEVAT